MKEKKQSILKSKISAINDITIKPKIAFSKSTINPLIELKKEKQRCFGIAKSIQLNTCLTENDTQEIEYLKLRVNNYSKNFVEKIQKESLTSNFEQLRAILSSADCSLFQDLTYQKYQDLYKTNPEIIKECFTKYRNTLLDTLDYRTLSSQEKKLLNDFISKKDVPKPDYDDKPPANGIANSAFFLFDNENGTHNYNNIPKNNANINVVDINSISSPVDNDRIQKLLMFNEFRIYVKNKDLSDDQINSLFNNSTDIPTAANNYFRMINNSEFIKLTYIFPNQTKHVYQFKFTDPLDYLILEVYKNHSQINSPYLVLSNGREFSFNPIEDKCIGSLFKNGNVLYVRSR